MKIFFIRAILTRKIPKTTHLAKNRFYAYDAIVMPEKTRVTIRDVARASGVSYPAVSVVLNEKKDSQIRVSDETRARILKSARDLGYVPNLAALSIKGYKKSLLGVFTYEKVFPVDARNEFYPFFAGIEQEAENEGFDLLILNNRPAGESARQSAHSRIFTTDGAVIIGIDRDDEGIRHLIMNGFPLIFVGRRLLEGSETNWITIDYRQGIEGLLRHMREKGSERLHYFRRGGIQREPQMDRERFTAELCEPLGFSSLKVHVIEGPCGDPSDFGLRDDKDCLLFDHLDTARLFCGQNRPPLFPELGKLRAAVAEDDWAGDFSDWTRLSNERVPLGRATIRLLVDIVNGAAETPAHKLIPVGHILGKSSEWE